MRMIFARSLRAQLGAILLGFLLLVASSVAATFLAARAQSSDAMVINLAGRQRMLTQQMTWLALSRPNDPGLESAMALFEQTLFALRDGGATLDAAGRMVTLPPAPDAALRAQLDESAAAWKSFRARLRSGDAPALQAESVSILARLDSIVSAFESRAQAKLLILQIIQLVFFASALGLVAWGHGVTRRRIVEPLATLGGAARHVAVGQFSESLPPMSDDELGEVGRAFDAMRAEVAVARGQLESQVAQRTREIVSAFEFSQEIVAQIDIDHLLRSVAERARELMAAQSASLCLLASDGDSLELAASSGEAINPPGHRQPVRMGMAAQVIGAGDTVVVERACSGCGFLRAQEPGQCAAAPLRVGERTLGALCVVRGNASPFDVNETRALTLLANSAAIAIANVQLAEAGRRQAERSAALAERERLAAELHDHLAQTLSYLALKADRIGEMLADGDAANAAPELSRVRVAVSDAYQQVRAALVGLREPQPKADNFAERLEAALTHFREASGIPAELAIADPSALALPQLAQTQVLHIVREALANVQRHARATRAMLTIDRVNGHARFSVEDNGRGFDPHSIDGSDHLGLTIMRARAERIGGHLRVDSTPGGGTNVAAALPLVEEST
ncbi:MAG: GAF domain-containing protein [Chloroflexi bacterium]|nr:GAF domain-containing protein [Chloroflexota bacterium]